MAAARGMQKVEFFTHIDEIRSMYEGGYVVLKILYKELQKKYNWSMSYWSFCKYMKEEIIASEKEVPAKQKPVSLPVEQSPKEMPVANLTSEDPQAGDNDIPQEEENSKVDELVKLYDNAISDKWNG